MGRLVADINRHLALEVARGRTNVAFVSIDGPALTLRRMNARDFDVAYPIEDIPVGHNGVTPCPRHYARTMLRSTWEIAPDALHALLSEMPLTKDEPRANTTTVLAAPDGAFLGAYTDIIDAALVAKFYPGSITVPRAAALSQWPAGQFAVLRQQVAPALKGRDSPKLREGVFTMATTAEKPAQPAPKKIESTKKERAPKGDGPIAKVAAYIKSNLADLKSGKLSRADAAAALRAAGLNKSTVGVQLPKQLAALGVAKPAKAAPKAKPAKAESKKPITVGTIKDDAPKAKAPAKVEKPKAPAKAKAPAKPAKK